MQYLVSNAANMCYNRAFTALYLLLFLSNDSLAIITRDQETSKPSYTSGIKTKNWHHSDTVQTHENYSKVQVHNKPDAQYIITQTERTIKLYPVYNSHPYGPGAEANNSFNSSIGESRAIYKRKIEYKTLNVYEKCPSGETGQFVYSLSCNQYLNCWKGKGSPQNCAPGTLFNPKTLECDFPSKVECLTGPRENTLGRRVSKSVKQATCPDDFTGLIPNYTDCSKFINCNAGQVYSMDCAPGTLFDMNRNICDHPNQVACFNGQNQGGATQSQSGHFANTGCGSNCGSSNGQGIKIGNSGGYHSHGQTSSGSEYLGTTQTQTQGHNSYGQGQNSYGQGQSTYGQGQNSYGQGQNSYAQVQNTYGQGQNSYGQGSTYNHHDDDIITQCDPAKSNCGRGIRVGSFNSQQGVSTQSQTGTHTYSYQGQGSQGQTYKGQAGTNLQNQGVIPGQTSQVHGHGRPCNPQTQNCNLSYGSTGQSGQTIGYSYGNSQVDSQKARCDPSTQICVSSNGQATITGDSQGALTSHQQGQTGGLQGINYQTSGSTSGLNYGQTTNTGLNQQGQGTSQWTTSGCNPFLQNCNQNSWQGESRSTFSPSGTTARPHNSYSQSNSGHTKCNPFLQDCGQNYGQSGRVEHSTITTGGQTACNPSLQNCNQHSGSMSQTGITQQSSYGHIQATNGCNPTLQNCNQQTSSTYEQNRGYSRCDPSIQNCNPNTQIGTGQTSCNPFLQNCAQHSGSSSQSGTTQQSSYSHSQSSGRCDPSVQNCNPNTQIGTGQTSCNPFLQNCAQHSGSSSQSRTTQQSSYNQSPSGCDPSVQNCNTPSNCTGHSCPNYSTICNINNPNCGTSHQIVAKSTEYSSPKCPGGYQGITKHPWDCKKFLNCANGMTFVQDCAPGTLFSPALGNCDFEYNVKCTVDGVSTEEQGGYGRHETVVPTTYRPVTPYPYRVSTTDSSSYAHRNQGGFTQRQSQIDSVTEGPNLIQNNNNLDYIDVFDPNEQTFGFKSTTPRNPSKQWPPPYPESSDYEFEYEDGEPVTLKPDKIFHGGGKRVTVCSEGDFHCNTGNVCVDRSSVCDGHRDCPNSLDETNCQEYSGRFEMRKNYRLEVLERQKWINVTANTCAYLCVHNTEFNCRSFNYRKIDKTCFLSDMNVGLTGALRVYYPVDYFELKTATVHCTDQSRYFECPTKKCITKSQLCDGVDDCGDRTDEKNCKKGDFGYSVRLAGSTNKNEGRVEITAFGKTGYICDDKFDISDANVVCRELGFELGAVEVKGQSFYANDVKAKNVPYLMDDLDCIGNETSLLDCDFSGWGVHNCRDLEIVGVECKTPQDKCGQDYWKCKSGNECVPISFVCDDLYDCTDESDEKDVLCKASTEIRLVNGSNPREGRLEIKHHGVWGTVCDDDFNEDAAKVVCKHLGFKGKPMIKKEAYFGAGSGPIWLDQVSCYGNETSVENCTLWGWGEHNCVHDEDVGVICNAKQELLQVPAERHSQHVFSADSPLKLAAGGKCGFRKDNQFLEDDLVHARVISGYTARSGDYPWQAAIKVKVKDKSAHWCGAIVISSKWILTAAHCLKGYAKSAYVVVAGEYNTDEDEGTEQQKYIEEFFIHEDFRKGHKMNNDIALIKLKGTGFVLNDDVQPICLPDIDALYDRDLNCTISGFGSVKSGIASYSHNLMAAWIPIHREEICKMPHIYGDVITEGMLCAGLLDGGVDACDGDSGGPLACLDRGVFTLYGITSWGQHCGYANKPGVYVKVAHYRSWIDDIIKKHSN